MRTAVIALALAATVVLAGCKHKPREVMFHVDSSNAYNLMTCDPHYHCELGQGVELGQVVQIIIEQDNREQTALRTQIANLKRGVCIVNAKEQQ